MIAVAMMSIVIVITNMIVDAVADAMKIVIVDVKKDMNAHVVEIAIAEMTAIVEMIAIAVMIVTVATMITNVADTAMMKNMNVIAIMSKREEEVNEDNR